MIAPKLYAWKGTKWIRKIEFLPENQRGFWELHAELGRAVVQQWVLHSVTEGFGPWAPGLAEAQSQKPGAYLGSNLYTT